MTGEQLGCGRNQRRGTRQLEKKNKKKYHQMSQVSTLVRRKRKEKKENASNDADKNYVKRVDRGKNGQKWLREARGVEMKPAGGTLSKGVQ